VCDADGLPIQGNWFGQSSFADVAVVAARNVIKVDATLPLKLLGPLACGVLTGAGSVFNCLPVESGSSIAIFGAGTVGLSAVMAAKVAEASTIVVVDVQRSRLQLAEKYGATHTFLAPTENLPRRIKVLVRGGLDAAFDTTGAPDVISTAVDVLRLRGVCGCVGAGHRPLQLRPDQLALGRTITGILEGDATPKLLIPRLIQLWQEGRFPFDELIEFFDLDQINDAEAAMKSGAVVKPVLLPSRSSDV
jgi:aryl-alcohol dehydrogenase